MLVFIYQELSPALESHTGVLLFSLSPKLSYNPKVWDGDKGHLASVSAIFNFLLPLEALSSTKAFLHPLTLDTGGHTGLLSPLVVYMVLQEKTDCSLISMLNPLAISAIQ